MSLVDRILSTPADHLRHALALIGTDCSKYTGPSTCVDDPSQSPYAPFLADRWCNQCIARTGLYGDPFPPVDEEGDAACLRSA